MPSLTMKMLYAVELTSHELFLILTALREHQGSASVEMDTLARKLEDQKTAFLKQMVDKIATGGV